MRKKVVSVLTIMALLFAMIPVAGPKIVQAATGEPITLYDLNKDSGLAGGTMASTAIQPSGGPTIEVLQGSNGPSLHVTNVVNSWDGLDLKSTALMQSDGSYLAGAYTFTVKGHVDPAVAAAYVDKDGKSANLQMVLGMSAGAYSWFANQVIDPAGDGKFTLAYTTTYAAASDLANLGYNFRIQKNGAGLSTSPTSFYIDVITVTAVPSTDPPAPPVPDNTLPVGTTVTVYDFDSAADHTVGGSAADGTALVKSGGPTISAVQGDDGTVSLLVASRANNWDGVDLQRAALMKDNAYYAGDYTFTVKGHIAPADVATSSLFVLGMSENPWGELTTATALASDGTFTLKYTKNYSSSAISKLGYNFRIQTRGKTPAAFYIDNITVTVTGTAPKVKQLYSFPFSDQAAQGSFFAPNSNAAMEWVNQAGIGHNDDTALQVTHLSGKSYTGADNAVRLTFRKALPVGAAYNISAWVYVPADANTGKSTLAGPGIVLNGDYTGSKFPADPGTITAGTWKELNVTLPVSTKPISTIDFYFAANDASTHPDKWLFDNIVISQIGDRIITPKWDLTLSSLADAYKGAFLVGNIMSPNQTTDTELTAMFKNQYNVVTAENAMKPQNLSSAKDQYNYTDADKIVDWAQANGIQVHGHTLVWHSQSADWLNKDASGKPLTREAARANMESYINNVVKHFSGDVISWDVVNEAFSNDVATAPTDWKTALRGAAGMPDKNPWYAAYANGADASKGESGADFIYDAFVFTRLADPNAKLFYNDYNETEAGKYEAIGMMAEDLNQKWAKDSHNTNPGRPLIEGVGMQAHYWTADYKTLAANVEAAIQRFIKAGVDISVSELDIPVGSYLTYTQNTDLTAENEALQADLYKQLFEIYNEYASHIDRVTFWAKADPQSWRSQGYPNLFDDSFGPKDAFYAVMDAKLKPTAPIITVPADGQIFILNSKEQPVWDAADDLSGILSKTIEGFDTSTVGERAYTLTATDKAGNSSTVTRTYKVVYNIINVTVPASAGKGVKAGSAVPISWQYADASGTPVDSKQANPVLTISDTALKLQAAGASGLQYDSATKTWQFNWKTPKSAAVGLYTITINDVNSYEPKSVGVTIGK